MGLYAHRETSGSAALGKAIWPWIVSIAWVDFMLDVEASGLGLGLGLVTAYPCP